MSTALKFADTKQMSREDWLKHRNKGIGGSDVSAICGLNPWRSPLSVYLEKTGQIEAAEENEAMRWGTLLEPVVAKICPPEKTAEYALKAVVIMYCVLATGAVFAICHSLYEIFFKK
jgi:putative phage-type endonuclease